MSKAHLQLFNPLFDATSTNKEKRVEEILKSNLEENKSAEKPDYFDLTYSDGLYFMFAIKYNNTTMLKLLLDYYKQTKLQGDRDTLVYKVNSHKLTSILEEALRMQYSPDEKVPIETMEILKPYLPTDDSDDEQDDDIEQDATKSDDEAISDEINTSTDTNTSSDTHASSASSSYQSDDAAVLLGAHDQQGTDHQ